MICMTPAQAAAAGARDADRDPPPTAALAATVTGLLAPHAKPDPAIDAA